MIRLALSGQKNDYIKELRQTALLVGKKRAVRQTLSFEIAQILTVSCRYAGCSAASGEKQDKNTDG